MFVTNMSAQAATNLINTIRLYMLPKFLLANFNSMIILRELTVAMNKLLTFQYEKNPNFLLALAQSSQTLLKISRLTFSESILGRYHFPDMYPKPSEQEKEPQTTASEETRKQMISLAKK